MENILNSGIDFLLKGGILVWPILLCSLVGTTIFIDRLLCFRAMQKHRDISLQILPLLAQKRYQEAENTLLGDHIKKRKPQRTSAERVLMAAVLARGKDRKTVEMILTHTVERELTNLSSRMGILAITGNIAPLLGLLGTVFGMIKAFMVVQAMGGRVNGVVLAGGIWEAMLTTAFGLLVAIPLIVFHGYLEAKLEKLQTEFETIAVEILKNWPKPKGLRVVQLADFEKKED